jgi:legumain
VIGYKGADVTAKTFLAVLSGDTAGVKGKGNGKVLKSTKADNVFVNFADHGGGETVEMPNGPYLYA